MHCIISTMHVKMDYYAFNDILKRVLFFSVAFLPLWLILYIQYFFSELSNIYGIISIPGVIITLPIVFWYYINQCYKHTHHQNFKVEKRNDITHEFVFYAVAYIPLSLIHPFEVSQALIFIIVIMFIGLLYIKTNMLHVNPILTLMGYKTYKIEDDHQNTAVFFSKFVVRLNADIQYRSITQNINLVLDR